MTRWEQVVEEYAAKAGDVPSFRTLAEWLNSSLPLLADCYEVINYGVLHIHKNGVPHTHVRVSNGGTKEYLDISFVTAWTVRGVAHKRTESVNLFHSQAPAYLSEMLARLNYRGDA
jgi:hypothetical protein